MAKIIVEVETDVSQSVRARQVSAMFDVPAQSKCKLRWEVDAPIDSFEWNVGLIVGPSGSGKSTVMRRLFETCHREDGFTWNGKSVIDDIAADRGVQEIAETCQAVGFNTVPAWLRPYDVLSNGEKFRVGLARLLLETPAGETMVVDEFTSLVDRQVAKIGAHAVQKYVRKHQREFVAVTCHYDVIDWLQPDWVLDMASVSFERRSLQRRPLLDCEIRRVDHSFWRVFAPFHYLTADLVRSASCFVLFVSGRPAAFAGVRHQPHAESPNIKAVSRLVTLPDWQGMGLALALVDKLGAAYKTVGQYLHTYPAHPSLIRSFDKSPRWALRQKPGARTTRHSDKAKIGRGEGLRPCAVFRYVGDSMEHDEAARMLDT